MRKLDITKDALDFWRSLDAKQYRQVGNKALSLLADPTPADYIHMKGSDFMRTDIGEFRIVYRFDDTTVYIAVIGRRNDDDAYKQAKRL